MQHPFDRICDEHGIEHRLTRPSSLDQWPSRANEPDGQGCNHQDIPLRHGRQPARARPGLPVSLQLRQAPQSPPMAHAVPGHLRRLENKSIRVQNQPAPLHPGTKHLGLRRVCVDGPWSARGLGGRNSDPVRLRACVRALWCGTRPLPSAAVPSASPLEPWAAPPGWVPRPTPKRGVGFQGRHPARAEWIVGPTDQHLLLSAPHTCGRRALGTPWAGRTGQAPAGCR